LLAALAIAALLHGTPPRQAPPLTHLSNSQVVRPQTAGNAGYYWATGYDSGNASGHAGENLSANLFNDHETLPDPNDHSLTEIWVQDDGSQRTSENAAEIGVMTDTAFWGTSNPVLFVDSWSNGHFNAYNPANNGFVSTSSTVTPGTTQPPVGQFTKYGFDYTGGKLYVMYNGSSIGYFNPTFWPGGWGGNTEAQVYGEAYNTTNGAQLPTMDGGIGSFAAGGPTINGVGASSPYQVHSITPTGFTFDGPH
jgi:hypothetical protein